MLMLASFSIYSCRLRQQKHDLRRNVRHDIRPSSVDELRVGSYRKVPSGNAPQHIYTSETNHEFC